MTRDARPLRPRFTACPRGLAWPEGRDSTAHGSDANFRQPRRSQMPRRAWPAQAWGEEGKGRGDRGLSPMFCLVGTGGFELPTP